jgi:hypothetical protein
LNGLRLYVLEALFEADRALIEHAQLLETERHVVGNQKENNPVVGIFLGLDLLEHCLRLLQQDEALLECLLRHEVNG